MATSKMTVKQPKSGLLERLFKLSEHNTDVKTEVLAGITTFMTLAYVIVVNPAILTAAGVPFGPSMTATILTSIIGTLLMGLYANRPFAIAPYMGTNAFVAYTVIQGMGVSWETALGAIFVGGILFVLVTVTGIRKAIVDATPAALKNGFAVGIGLFLTYVGLFNTGMVVSGDPVSIGDFTSRPVLLAVIGLILISILMVRKVKGALLIGIVLTTIVAIPLGVTQMPEKIFSLPPSIAEIALKMDFIGVFSIGMLTVVFTLFLNDFLSTMGTLIGCAYKAGFLDENGNLPEIEKPMLADAIATCVAALLGTTTAGTYVESAAGVEEGGRTGLTAVVTALLFAVTLLLSPIAEIIPNAATGPALLIVGLLMLSPIKEIDFDDYTEAIPAFITIIMMSFTYNPAAGIAAGYIIYPILQWFAGKGKNVHPINYIVALLCILYFVVL